MNLQHINLFLRTLKMRSIRYYFNLLNPKNQEIKTDPEPPIKMTTWMIRLTFTTSAWKKRKKMNLIMRSPTLTNSLLLKKKIIFDTILYSYFILLMLNTYILREIDFERDSRKTNKIKKSKLQKKNKLTLCFNNL